MSLVANVELEADRLKRERERAWLEGNSMPGKDVYDYAGDSTPVEDVYDYAGMPPNVRGPIVVDGPIPASIIEGQEVPVTHQQVRKVVVEKPKHKAALSYVFKGAETNQKFSVEFPVSDAQIDSETVVLVLKDDIVVRPPMYEFLTLTIDKHRLYTVVYTGTTNYDGNRFIFFVRPDNGEESSS
jgi:hypothetical protein